MKIIVLLLALGNAFLSYSQEITIEVTGSIDSTIDIKLPLKQGSYNFLQTKQTYKLDGQQHAKFLNPMPESGAIDVYLKGFKTDRIFVEHGKDLFITIDMKGKRPLITINGPNESGIQLSRSIGRTSIHSKARSYIQPGNTITSVKAVIKAESKAELLRFDSLLAINEISKDFYRHQKRDIDYYYATVYSLYVFNLYLHNIEDSTSEGYAVRRDELEKAWQDSYNEFPLNDQFATGSPHYNDYAESYIIYYKVRGSRDAKYEDMLPKYYDGFEENFKGHPREHILAYFLYLESIQKKYESTLPDLYKRFIHSYPKGAYTGAVQRALNEANDFQARAAAPLDPDMKIIETASLQSFADLLSLFRDKTVYIDLWATWCGPCKAEFKHNVPLKKFLSENNIAMLYVSLDDSSKHYEWQSMIKYFHLSGYNVRAGVQLRNEMDNIFGEGFQIPRYAIIKNGVLVENNALRPSDNTKLFTQLKKYL